MKDLAKFSKRGGTLQNILNPEDKEVESVFKKIQAKLGMSIFEIINIKSLYLPRKFSTLQEGKEDSVVFINNFAKVLKMYVLENRSQGEIEEYFGKRFTKNNIAEAFTRILTKEAKLKIRQLRGYKV